MVTVIVNVRCSGTGNCNVLPTVFTHFAKLSLKIILFETASFTSDFVMNGKNLSIKVQKQLVYPKATGGYLFV